MWDFLKDWIISITEIILQWIFADEEQLEKFKQKFAHLSEFFHLYEAIRGKNNVFSLRWKCNICESGQTIRSTSNAPTSNLKTHVSKLHPEHSGSFLTFREYNKISTSNNPVFVHPEEEAFCSSYPISTPSKNVFKKDMWINVIYSFLNYKYVVVHFD